MTFAPLGRYTSLELGRIIIHDIIRPQGDFVCLGWDLNPHCIATTGF